MGRTSIAAAVALLICTSSTVAETKIYKCVGANGTVVFSQNECGKDASVVEIRDHSRPAQSSGNDALQAIADRATLSGLETDCSAKNTSINANFDARIEDVHRQIARLREDMEYSRNNLAGATRDTGIQTQISGLETRLASLETARDAQIASAQASCDQRRDAEIARQAAQHAASQAAAPPAPPAKPAESETKQDGQ